MNIFALWATYFSSVASMQHHPGAGTKEHKQLTLEECAAIADQMLDISIKRFARMDPEK